MNSSDAVASNSSRVEHACGGCEKGEGTEKGEGAAVNILTYYIGREVNKYN
jgi:hypothetical protein